MGMFYREDRPYDESVRQTGFRRYQQLLSIRFGRWWKTNLMTLAGFLPLAAGIIYAIGTSSVLVMLPCSILGGIIAGPFLAGLYDAILRGLRDDPQPWWDCYKRALSRIGRTACSLGRCWDCSSGCTHLWECCSGGRKCGLPWEQWCCTWPVCCWCWRSIRCTGPSWCCSARQRGFGCEIALCFAL